jgi:NADH dehydrogenase
MSTAAKKVVILGGGFAGVYTAKYLQRRLPANWEIVLFSRENHFIFTPLLGDVVGSSINPMHVVWPIRQMVRHSTCRTAEVTRLDLAGHAVHYKTAAGQTAHENCDHVVLACGSVVNLDIVPGMAAHGWPFKTMGDALLLHNHLIGQLEKAEVEPDPARRKQLLSVIVVGGGFSGVEVAGEIADLLLESSRFYSNVKPGDIRVTVLEGRERLLPELPESLSEFALRKMTRRGIDIRLKVLAQSVSGRGVSLRDGTQIEAATVVCTIGTTVSPLIKDSVLPLERGRIKTAPDMRVEGHDHVWALGDCAAVLNAYDGKLSAPTAQVAVRQGKQLAANLLATIEGQPTRPFSYKPMGMLASIGNHKAVALVFGLRISGFPAWFLWRGVYLAKMPTLARKIQIAFDWAWQLIFPRDIVQLNLEPTQRLAEAHFEPGQFVFHKGEEGDKFYIIERGKAGVYLDESAPAVAGLTAGDHFGEGSLLRGSTRSASVRAEEPLDVLVVDKNSFTQLAGHLDVLRQALERSAQGSRSAAELIRLAKDHPRLGTLPVRAAMSQPVVTLPLDLNFGEALRRSQAMGKGAYPVVDAQGRMVGLLTRTDFYNALQKLQPPETPLAEVMHRPVLTVRESEPVTTALLTFLREPIKRVVVVADDEPQRPVGMVTPFDIMRVVADGAEADGVPASTAK